MSKPTHHQHNTRDVLSAVNCPSCGGELSIPEQVEYVQCPYCRTSVKVREIEQTASLLRPASVPESPSAAAPPPGPKPWYRTAWGMWIAFFVFLPAWVVLVLSDPDQPRFLKISAWILVGLMAYSILISTIN